MEKTEPEGRGSQLNRKLTGKVQHPWEGGENGKKEGQRPNL